MSGGDNGNSAIVRPTGWVKFALSSRAPKAYNSSRALIIEAEGGGDMNSKRSTLSIPIAFNCRITVDRLLRCISGTRISLKATVSGSRTCLRLHNVMESLLGIKSVCLSRLDTTCSSCSLIGRGLGDWRNYEGFCICLRVVRSYLIT